ncbi:MULTISPECIES: thymidylate synthase [Streptomyces]|uniref:thymidylate synthase n=1 Tax=Streptomyces TaxID=1883 RepID=UPI0007671665|nr:MULTISPECIES: thymidylate synthase [Streptomyces]MDN3055985.1 thymidylate synthase [Streptomyces sp. SRF1]
MTTFPGFQAAYLHHVADLLHDPQFHNAPRGFASQERLGVSFLLDDPRRRLITHPARRTNVVFNFAEALWYLAGRDDLDYLAYYAPSVARYSADGRCLTGTAYGPRIFRYGARSLDQWATVVDTLRQDPDSKRAVIQILRPEELHVTDNPDVACTLCLQFLLREGRLHMVGYMRANDVYRGMVSDVFSFTFLQEMMARQLGAELGGYTHVAGSLHLYQPDLPAARRLVDAPLPAGLPADAMDPLPEGDNRPYLTDVLRIEEQLRTDALRLDPDRLDALGLPGYWSQVVALFELYRRVRHGPGPDDPGPDDGLVDRLSPLYRHLMVTRFPALAAPHHPMEVSDAAR